MVDVIDDTSANPPPAKSAHLTSHDAVETGLAAAQDSDGGSASVAVAAATASAAQSSPVNPSLTDCEEPLVKIEVNSSPGIGDFNQQTAFSLPLDLNYPLLNATEIKSSPWSYPDFPEGTQKNTSSPSTSSEKSLPPFQDSTNYTAYTSMQASTYSSNTSSGGYPPTHGNGFYGNSVHSGYSPNLSLPSSYGTKHPTTSSYLSHYPTAFSSPQGSTSASSQIAPSQTASVYSSYPSFPSANPSQGFSQHGPLDYSPYGYGNYYYGSAAGQSYPGSGYASALSQLTQGAPTTATPAYSAAITPTDLTYSLSSESSPPSPLMFNKRNRSSKRSRKSNLPAHSLSPEAEQPMDRVFIWDLDEAIVMLNALLNGKFATDDRKDLSLTKQYATKLQQLMYFVADAHLYYQELGECDQVNVDDVSSDEQLALQQQDPNNPLIPLAGGLCINGTRPAGIDWMRKLANRYQRIREVYKECASNVGPLLNGSESGGPEEWLKLRQKLEEATDNWLTHAQMCIELINQRSNCINVLVSSNQLVITLSKLLLFGLGEHFPIENVYSAQKISKESCFERIVSKFGKKCTYVVIGASEDDEKSCKALSIPFWPVSRRSDLDTLYYTLDVGHL